MTLSTVNLFGKINPREVNLFDAGSPLSRIRGRTWQQRQYGPSWQ